MNDKDNYFLPFPKRLRLLFDETRVNQQEVADYVGVSRQAVSQWKDGKTIPDMYNFRKIAKFFNVPMEYLLGETESKVNENMDIYERLGLSDKAISKLQSWLSEKQEFPLSQFPRSVVLSDIIADSGFDTFIFRIQQYIAEYVEKRLHEEDEHNRDYYASKEAIDLVEREADNYARYSGLRTIRAEDLSTYYKYQAMEALGLTLLPMPEGYYTAYRQKQDEEGARDGKHTAEKK